jgi:hypothetical protein
MGSQNQYRNTLHVDGIGSIGVFDTWSGGEADSDEVKYSPGGMGAEEAQGGRQTVGNVTLGRQYKRDRDHALVRQLIQVRGRARVSAHRQPLDADGNAYGAPLVYTGFLKAVSPQDVDSNSSDPDTFEVEISTDGTIG